MNITEQMLREFEREGDLIGLWQIVSRIRRSRPGLSRETVLKETLDFVRTMLQSGFEVGDPPYSARGYNRWNSQDVDKAITRIEDEWSVLGRDPDLADIAWFRPPLTNI